MVLLLSLVQNTGIYTADRFGFRGSGDIWGECGKCSLPFYTKIHQNRHNSCTISPEAAQAQHKAVEALPATAAIKPALDESGRLLELATRLPFPCGPFGDDGHANDVLN